MAIRSNSSVLPVLVAGMLLFLGGAAGAQVAVDCASVNADPAQQALDADGDGFSNGTECSAAGVVLDPAIWPSTSPFAGRSIATDPGVRDLVVFVQVASPSLLCADPLDSDACASEIAAVFAQIAPVATVHVLASTSLSDFPSTADRRVNAEQVGVFLLEDVLRTTGSILGECLKSPLGQPSGIAKLFPVVIESRVGSECPTGFTCEFPDGTVASIPEVSEKVAGWVANHEVLHCLDVTAFATSTGYHRAFSDRDLRSDTVPTMGNAYVVKQTTKRTLSSTFYIPNVLDSADVGEADFD
jgi:hypothetical protein